MGDLLDIGHQCSQCSQIDYLPIHCPFCSQCFCKDHISADAHTCPAAPKTSLLQSSELKLQRCALDKCNEPSLNAYRSPSQCSPTCEKCQQSFCAKHRDPAAHECLPKSPSPDAIPKNQTVRALLAKHFPSSSASRAHVNQTRLTASKRADPAKSAQLKKLDLMKMRQKAVPADPRHEKSSVPINRRRIFKAKVDEKPEKILWVEESVVAGKAFDLLASQLGISTTDSTRYQICKLSDTDDHPVRLQNDRPFSEQVDDGDMVILSSKVDLET